MQSIVYFWALLFHFFAAAFWVGGMFFFVFVFRSVYTDPELKEVKSRLLFKVAVRFRSVSYLIFLILAVSGIGILFSKGFYLNFGDANYWTSFGGSVFLLKISLFLFLVGSSAIHDFLVGPIAFQEMENDPEIKTKYRKYASFFGRLNLIVSIGIAILGLAFSRGIRF